MLSSGVCHNLSTLDTTTTKDNIIFTLLKNATNLKRLALRNGSVDFNELNTLHTNAPNLTTLDLNDVDVTTVGFEENINNLVSSLVQFTFNDVNIGSIKLHSDVASIRKLLVYIANQYPNLSSLDFSLYFEDINFQCMGSFISTMGSQLDTLSLGIASDGHHLFEALVRSSCQVKYFSITGCSSHTFINISQSQHVNCIQTLVLVEGYLKTYAWLKKFKVLKELNLSSSDKTQFSDVLDHITPTLISLTLCGYRLAVLKSRSKPSHIKTLTLGYVHCPEKNRQLYCSKFSLII